MFCRIRRGRSVRGNICGWIEGLWRGKREGFDMCCRGLR